MAIRPHGLTVSLPSGSVSEAYSISVSQAGQGIGFNNSYNPNAGTVSVQSYDNPGSTVGVRGTFSVSGGVDQQLYSLYGYVTSVDSTTPMGGVVSYTTQINLVTQP